MLYTMEGAEWVYPPLSKDSLVFLGDANSNTVKIWEFFRTDSGRTEHMNTEERVWQEGLRGPGEWDEEDMGDGEGQGRMEAQKSGSEVIILDWNLDSSSLSGGFRKIY